ncbi:MAG TPA: glycyl-radical enzyme activating protein [Candidatus Sumerlaeota bacterium]|nr:glycyl-radical enzyme activating protein [Candidatus Sumerlaeota bacterium]
MDRRSMRIFATGWSEGYDGPGRRWVVYLKGCNLNCRWCANPEGIETEPQMLFRPGRAAQPDAACPEGAVTEHAGGWRLSRERCVTCRERRCIQVWRHPAFEWVGEDVFPSEIVRRVLKARGLFGAEGGVTFGGGEPTLQIEEVLEAVRLLRREAIHVAVESNAATETFASIPGEVDLLICDLKCATSELHREWTGLGNERVLWNLRQAVQVQPRMTLRIPLIPGFNDSPEEMSRIGDFLSELSSLRRERAQRGGWDPVRVEILRLHHLGEPKYAALDWEYPMVGVAVPDRERAESLAAILQERGHEARVLL